MSRLMLTVASVVWRAGAGFGVVLAAMLFSACVKSQNQAGHPPSTSAEGVAQARLETTVPTLSSPPSEIAQASSAPPASIHSVADLRPDQQRYMEGRIAAYGGLIVTGEGVDEGRLLALGYPSMAQWLAAKAMSDAQLKAAADQGDYFSRVLLAERYVSRMVEMREETGESGDYGVLPGLAAGEVGGAMRLRPSPFLAMLDVSWKFAMDGRVEHLVAGYLAAERLGDPRAGRLATELRASHPGLSERLIQTTLEGALIGVPNGSPGQGP